VTGVEETLIGAISSRRVVEFRYRRLPRIAEPHTLAINPDGVEQLLAYQLRGRSTSGRLPDWRRFDVDAIDDLAIRDETFAPRPAPTGRHSRWQRIIAFVPEAQP
jgi:hypothetical protein